MVLNVTNKQSKLESFIKLNKIKVKDTNKNDLEVIRWDKFIDDEDSICIVGVGKSNYLPVLFKKEKVVCIDKDEPDYFIPLASYEKADAMDYDFSRFSLVIINRVCEKGDASAIFNVTKHIIEKYNNIKTVIIEFCNNHKHHYNFEKIKNTDIKVKGDNNEKAWSLANLTFKELINKGYQAALTKKDGWPKFLLASKNKGTLERILKEF